MQLSAKRLIFLSAAKKEKGVKVRNMKNYEFYLAGSLEKVFWNRMPQVMEEGEKITILQGEVPALQLVYRGEPTPQEGPKPELTCEVKGFPTAARLRDVEPVPSAFPVNGEVDDNYLSREPGMFPDLLKPKRENKIVPIFCQYRSVWIDFPDTREVSAGVYPVEILISSGENISIEEEAVTLHFSLEVLDCKLPHQELIHTQWFHADCLADFYHTQVFGDFHWKVIEEQIKLAGELGINMLLTPVFTPPLDTEVGGERTTVQLVDIALQEGEWTFGFDKLEKWCGICQKYGIEYIEVPHLFTQWGAKATPKILVEKEGRMEKMFGWHVKADDPSYRSFLKSFLPALQKELLSLGFTKEQIYFHISDEPSAEHLESYQAAKAAASDLLEGWLVIDALSDFDFYEKGLVERPVPANNHIQPFADHQVPDLWTYYCCSQKYQVPNRFFSMPSARNRIMGVLMYLYHIRGFLHWGYNFYNSVLSKEHINPFLDTHANYAFPSGDSFLVYPGIEGKPWSSIRGEVQRQGIDDMRALEALEALAGREAVEELIYEGQDKPFTFTSYPKEASYLYELRRKIGEKMKEYL